MKITQDHITDELLCAMRVHLMNETEMHVFCPKDVRVWEENCHNVEFLNFTAISEVNELAMTGAFKNSLHRLLDSYVTTSQEDSDILEKQDEINDRHGGDNDDDRDDRNDRDEKDSNGGDGGDKVSLLGPVLTSVIRLRLREKKILLSALSFLDIHEKAIHNGTVPFQLNLKAQERIDANRREEERQKFLLEIQKRIAIRTHVAVIEVNLGENIPKVNLTLEEGQSLHDVVVQFCTLHKVGVSDMSVLENALGKRVVSPTPLDLMLGVVVPSGERKILGVPTGESTECFPFIFSL